MARVTGFTAERMQAIEDTCIVDGAVLLDNLILTQRDGTEINAGNVRGPQGPSGVISSATISGLAAGAAPTLALGGTPEARTMAFGIPKGDTGDTGPSGTIASATANGLAAGAAPTITLGGTPQARTMAFGIPKGDTGADGVPGSLATPAGTIALWGSDTAPANWLICDGSAISRTTYASLFAIIGTKYGAGDGVNTFNLPNLKGQTPIGKDAAQTEFAALNQKGGEKAHLLSIAEMPAHNHIFGAGQNVPVIMSGATSYYWNAPTGPDRVNFTGGTANTGGGAAHNILQPYTVVNFIIKVTNGDTPGDSQLTQRVSTVESWMGQTPAGTVTIWGGDTAPTNWLLCDGSAISRTTYASLFAVIGIKYGAGDGSTTFNLPNFKGRVPAGLDTTQTEFNALGKTGGTKTHTHQHLSPLGMASNNIYALKIDHAQMDDLGQYDFDHISAAALYGGGWATGAAGAMELHRVTSSASGTLQPYLTVNYIIKFTNGDTQGDSQLTQRVSTLEAGNTTSVRTDRKTARIQAALTGGGVRKAGASGISWTERFIAMGSDRDDLALSGYFDINFPANGTVIPILSNASGQPTSTTVANSTITLNVWQALYYNLPYGNIYSDAPSRFLIVDYQSVATADIPSSAILLCIRNADLYSPHYTWGDGKSQDYWRAISMTNGWVNYGGAYQAAAYRIADTGEIVCKGLIASGAIGVVTTFPAVMKPAENAIFVCQSNTGAARLDMDAASGSLYMQAYFSGGSNAYVSLAAVRWFPTME